MQFECHHTIKVEKHYYTRRTSSYEKLIQTEYLYENIDLDIVDNYFQFHCE